MMDIKVKCWNNELKEWDKCAYPIFEGMNPIKIIGYLDNEDGEKLIEDGHVVILYTGLRDKNGFEIYEGDILKFDHKEGYAHQNQVVSLNKWSFGTDEYDFFEIVDRNYNFEVIGNIYENPELIDK